MKSLSSLSLRTAEIESIVMIRDIASKAKFPLSKEYLDAEFSFFYISDTDKEVIGSSIKAIQPLVHDIVVLSEVKGNIYEPINLQRSINLLKESERPLINNLKFIGEIFIWQKDCVESIIHILNSIPNLNDQKDRVYFNEKLNEVFMTILRNNEFSFNSKDIINEMHKEHISALKESMSRGFLFHVTLEEELRHEDFSQIKGRIPDGCLSRVEEISRKMEIIKKGIDRAYDINLRMVNLALLLYCYIKILKKD